MDQRSIQRVAWGIAGYALLGIVILASLVLGLASCASRPAQAHSWFPQDCWTMGTDSDAREPDPSLVQGGYLTFDGQFVPHEETRPSPDGRFHICRRGGAVTGQVIWPEKRPICMWTPRPNS